MKRSWIFICVVVATICQSVYSQTTFPENGVANPNHDYYAFVNATIYVTAENVIHNGTLLIRDGKVKAVGNGITLPPNTVKYDIQGKYIYPSFIDLYSEYGILKEKPNGKKPAQRRSTQLKSKKKGAYGWNEAVKAEQEAFTSFTVDAKAAKELMKQGFGTVLTHRHDGIVRGTSALVTLGLEEGHKVMVEGSAAFQLAFHKGSSKQSYPTSLMGIISLIRQTYYDAQWYEQHETEEYNITLEAFNKNKHLPTIIDASGGYQSMLRADKVGDEFEVDYIIKGNGDAYKRIASIQQMGTSLIVPLNFPKPVDVSNPYDALNVSLSEMKSWESAPANAAYLEAGGVSFSFTAAGLKKKNQFLIHLRKAVKYGLSETTALKALTSVPAQQINKGNLIGGLNEGMLANFIITSGNLFKDKTIIYENWVQGKQNILHKDEIDIRGTYNLNIDKKTYGLQISGSKEKPTATIQLKKGQRKANISHKDRSVQLSFTVKEDGVLKSIRIGGNINDAESRIWAGKAETEKGNWVDWAAIRQVSYTEKEKKDTVDQSIKNLGAIWYPNGAYGFDSVPSVEIVIFHNATIWTNEDTGILVQSDVAIAEGKILAVGTDLSRVGLFGERDVNVIDVDAKGKHITSGIIDEHSHIAISKGVNEAGWAISAEVRIGDVINADDVNIYRQLAGGVTASQLLHGSANPIGGQSALIKLRWGKTAEEFKIEGAAPFIKFALGENVKQSNWGDHNKVRFPQTRMGVEQVYYDAFTRAQEYGEAWTLFDNALQAKRKRKDAPLIPPRRDLRLEALAQILNEQRFITCHSYIQSEINMLMHVADSMNFRVNTFTHVLEGYKIADKLKAHGAGASTFSDWWAYKFEVNDAIPYNGAILTNQGVVTAFNSDDAEMGRRLNQEAAKAVKYGNLTEEDAWKLVTLNPAKLLHLDDRMGSIKAGKDADIVVWSDHPLSVNAKVEQTYIDGVCYFDRNRDLELRNRVKAERARLIQKLMLEKKKGTPLKKPKMKQEKTYHCDDLD